MTGKEGLLPGSLVAAPVEGLGVLPHGPLRMAFHSMAACFPPKLVIRDREKEDKTGAAVFFIM